MIEKIQEFNLEKRVRIYRKCVEIILSKAYKRGNSVIIEGLELSFNDLLDICYYVVPVYGSNAEQVMFFNMYGTSNLVLDDSMMDNVFLDRLMYIYNYREKNCKNANMMKRLARNLNIRISDIVPLARDYAVNYLNYDIKDYDWHIFCKKRGNIKARMSYTMLFDLLLRFDNEEDIIYIIDYSGVNIGNYNLDKLNSYVDSNYKDKTEEEKLLIVNNINKKIDLYKKIKRSKDNSSKMKKMAKNLEIAREFLGEYVNASKSYKYKSDYCKDIGVRDDLLYDMLNVLKRSELEVDRRLYNLCEKKIIDDKMVGSSDVNYIANVISEYIINGVSNGDKVRDFDLIDFYSLTNLSSKEIVMACEKSLKREDYIKVRKFFVASDKLKRTLMNSKKAIDMDIEFDCRKDKEGFPIVGTGRKLSEEEREEILELFDKYNIPLYLFKIAIDRIKKGIAINDLVVSSKEVKKKVKIHD